MPDCSESHELGMVYSNNLDLVDYVDFVDFVARYDARNEMKYPYSNVMVRPKTQKPIESNFLLVVVNM